MFREIMKMLENMIINNLTQKKLSEFLGLEKAVVSRMINKGIFPKKMTADDIKEFNAIHPVIDSLLSFKGSISGSLLDFSNKDHHKTFKNILTSAIGNSTGIEQWIAIRNLIQLNFHMHEYAESKEKIQLMNEAIKFLEQLEGMDIVLKSLSKNIINLGIQQNKVAADVLIAKANGSGYTNAISQYNKIFNEIKVSLAKENDKTRQEISVLKTIFLYVGNTLMELHHCENERKKVDGTLSSMIDVFGTKSEKLIKHLSLLGFWEENREELNDHFDFQLQFDLAS